MFWKILNQSKTTVEILEHTACRKLWACFPAAAHCVTFKNSTLNVVIADSGYCGSRLIVDTTLYVLASLKLLILANWSNDFFYSSDMGLQAAASLAKRHCDEIEALSQKHSNEMGDYVKEVRPVHANIRGRGMRGRLGACCEWTSKRQQLMTKLFREIRAHRIVLSLEVKCILLNAHISKANCHQMTKNIATSKVIF